MYVFLKHSFIITFVYFKVIFRVKISKQVTIYIYVYVQKRKSSHVKDNNRKKIIKLIKFPSRHALKKMLSKAFSCRLKVCLYIQTPDILLITQSVQLAIRHPNTQQKLRAAHQTFQNFELNFWKVAFSAIHRRVHEARMVNSSSYEKTFLYWNTLKFYFVSFIGRI